MKNDSIFSFSQIICILLLLLFILMANNNKLVSLKFRIIISNAKAINRQLTALVFSNISNFVFI